MRAVILREFNQPLVVVDDYPEPGPARGCDGAAGEVIEVTACGVCHSDLHVSAGRIRSPLPLVLGHEVTGVHPALGPVIVYAPWGCGSCFHCRTGLEMICADVAEAGIFADGGYAERIWVPDRRYLAALGDLDPVSSAPLACGGLTAYRAVGQCLDELRRCGRSGRALLIGAGGLGQFAIRLLRLLTSCEVIALDISASKRATALEMGAHSAVTAEDLSSGGFPACDVVIDFIGAAVTLTAAATVVKRQGLVVVVGLAGGRIDFGFGAVPHEARFMSSVWGTRAQLDELLELARSEPSVTAAVETLPLTSAGRAHRMLAGGSVEGRMVLTVARQQS